MNQFGPKDGLLPPYFCFFGPNSAAIRLKKSVVWQENIYFYAPKHLCWTVTRNLFKFV